MTYNRLKCTSYISFISLCNYTIHMVKEKITISSDTIYFPCAAKQTEFRK